MLVKDRYETIFVCILVAFSALFFRFSRLKLLFIICNAKKNHNMRGTEEIEVEDPSNMRCLAYFPNEL